jgi:hypothetical protein
MNRKDLVKVFVVTAALAIFVSSHASADMGFEFNIGMDSPVGDLNEYWRVGLGLNGGFFGEITPFVSAGVTAGFSLFGLDENHVLEVIEAPDDYAIDGGSMSVFSLCAELRAHAGAMDKATFFGGIGGGLFVVNLDEIRDPADELVTSPFDWENKIGGYINAGMSYPISDMVGLGFKLKYTIFSAGSDIGFLELEDTRSYFSVHGLLTFKL